MLRRNHNTAGTASGTIPVSGSNAVSEPPAPATPETPAGGQNTAPTPAPAAAGDKASATPVPASGSAPTAPSGSFVSSHSIGLDSNLESVCLTTPAASCVITFTKDDITKSLPAQTVNANGGTTWNWNAKAAGLTTGSWHITTSASLNGQTAKTNDLQDLKVQ